MPNLYAMEEAYKSCGNVEIALQTAVTADHSGRAV
jgi:hypothetical protein